MSPMYSGLALILLAGIAAPGAAQDAAAGRIVFRFCAECHEIGPSARDRVGPRLSGVIGRPAGSVPSFSYSRSLQAAGAAGLVWTVGEIDAWLAGPTTFLREVTGDPRSRAAMTFRLEDAQARRDVIAYLAAAGG